jgi:transketolase
MSSNEGLKYIRTTRPKTPIIYSDKENFPIGDFKILKKSKSDKAIIVAAGITVHEALKAHKELKKEGKNLAVLDCYSIKPFPEEKLVQFAKQHGNKIIVVEDHRPEGGLGEAVAKAIVNSKIKLIHLAVNEIPHSGNKEELMSLYNIDSNAIISAI